MVSLKSADRRTSSVTPTDLRTAGFNEAQACAIAELAQARATEAVEGLRAEFARWHAYLALYVVAQIAIVFLAVLLTQSMPERTWTPPELSGVRDVLPLERGDS